MLLRKFSHPIVSHDKNILHSAIWHIDSPNLQCLKFKDVKSIKPANMNLINKTLLCGLNRKGGEVKLSLVCQAVDTKRSSVQFVPVFQYLVSLTEEKSLLKII